MESIKKYRNYGYDLIINNFEPLLREYIHEEIFAEYFPDSWKDHIPERVLRFVQEFRRMDPSEFEEIDEFLEEISIPNLREIILRKEIFPIARNFIGDNSRSKFSRLMKKINMLRIKIAHAKSSYSQVDFSETVSALLELCKGEYANRIKNYINERNYIAAQNIPEGFFEDYECANNLPAEDYDMDGGFVGRETEIEDVVSRIESEQDRVITLTGAGGAGKTAIALKVSYFFLESEDLPFEAIIWFSAKNSKLTDEGISPLDSQISSFQQLVEDIFEILDPFNFKTFKADKIPTEYWVNHLNNILSSQKCLLVIDNLETIYSQSQIIEFIKNIPRPSCVLITSRRGLGEIERRIPIGDMPLEDAVMLFKLVSRARDQGSLVNLPDPEIEKLVNRVRRYPLLIKWSIGQVSLGKDVEEAFLENIPGDSEIAKFSFNDVFQLLTENAKRIVYGMIIYGMKPITRYLIQHLANLDDDQFETAIKELMLSSLVFEENLVEENQVKTEYNMLTLTRGFIETKLDEDKKTRMMLLTRYHDLSEQIQELEKSVSDYNQTFLKLGIKTAEEKIAVNYAKSARQDIQNNDFAAAEEKFLNARTAAPHLSYIWSENAKFEFTRGHIPQALQFAKKATELDKDDYLSWWNYGVLLTRARKLDEAVPILERAKKLNPDYLPTYQNLGEVFSLQGRYEEAESEFETALREEKYPNYRHMMYTLLRQAENYQRWAVSYRKREDYQGQLEPLERAYQTIKKALGIKPYHPKLLKALREICLDYGIALGYQQDISYKDYLEESIEVWESEFKSHHPNRKILATAYFYLARFGGWYEETEGKIRKYLDRAVSYCDETGFLYDRIQNLRKGLGIASDPSTTIKNRKKDRLSKEIEKSALLMKQAIENRMKENKTLDLAGIKTNIIAINSKFDESGMGYKSFRYFVEDILALKNYSYRLVQNGTVWALKPIKNNQ